MLIESMAGHFYERGSLKYVRVLSILVIILTSIKSNQPNIQQYSFNNLECSVTTITTILERKHRKDNDCFDCVWECNRKKVDFPSGGEV